MIVWWYVFHAETTGWVLAQSRETQMIMRYLLHAAFFPSLQNPWIILQELSRGKKPPYVCAFYFSYFMFFELHKYKKMTVSGEAEIEIDGMSCNYMAATWADKNKINDCSPAMCYLALNKMETLPLYLGTFVLPYYTFLFTEIFGCMTVSKFRVLGPYLKKYAFLWYLNLVLSSFPRGLLTDPDHRKTLVETWEKEPECGTLCLQASWMDWPGAASSEPIRNPKWCKTHHFRHLLYFTKLSCTCHEPGKQKAFNKNQSVMIRSILSSQISPFLSDGHLALLPSDSASGHRRSPLNNCEEENTFS